MAEALGLPVSTILSWARSGLLTPRRGPRGAHVFSFQDIALLRTARELLSADLPPRRVRAALATLREQLPQGRPLSAVRIRAEGLRILVQDGEALWEPSSGQLALDLPSAPAPAAPAPAAADAARTDYAAAGLAAIGPEEAGASVTPITLASPLEPVAEDAETWFDRGVELESTAPERAAEAYRRAVALEPDHAEAHLNLGRLLHEVGELDRAEEHYRSAVRGDPESGRAAYNLGVALEDRGDRAGALEAYQQAVQLEPGLAVAHFNLSRLHEAADRPAEALQHLAEYKRILDRSGCPEPS